MDEGSLKNSEILFIYEVKLANPNGDPDDENRPRIDPKTKTNLVTDVRLKRFFRDYVIDKFGEDHIWVSKQDGQNVDATERFKHFDNDPDKVLKMAIDARLFGATIPKKKGEKESKGESYSFIGPLQFAWGHSLHKVDMVDTRSITSLFSGREVGEGNIGKDYRVYYSLIAFYGAFNKNRASTVKCTQNDIKIFDNFVWEAVKSESITRSKIGHYPHLYLRVELEDNESYIGDLRRFIKVKQKTEGVRKLDDLELDFSDLLNVINGHNVYVNCSEEFKQLFCEKLDSKGTNYLPHKEVNLSALEQTGVKA